MEWKDLLIIFAGISMLFAIIFTISVMCAIDITDFFRLKLIFISILFCLITIVLCSIYERLVYKKEIKGVKNKIKWNLK